MSNYEIDSYKVSYHMLSFLRTKSAILGLALAFTAGTTTVSAATITHYLLLQADFTSATAGLETYKFKITYDSSLSTKPASGLDLVTAIFGTVVMNDPQPIDEKVYMSTGGSALGVAYRWDDAWGYSIHQFLVGGNAGPEAQNTSPWPYWNYLVAGGTGDSGTVFGSDWEYSFEDGAGSRNLADGSFDAWTYGSTYPYVDVTGSSNDPVSTNFLDVNKLLFTANGISVYAAPEPGRFLLLAAGLLTIALRRTPRRRPQPTMHSF